MFPPDDPVHVPIEEEIDLHAFAPGDVRSVVDEYLRAAHERGFEAVRVVHGRGRGVQRAIVQQLLAGHPLVAAFQDDHRSHLGATLVKLVPRE